MTQKATHIEVPNFEATTDGKKIFTPKQSVERQFRQYTKRKHKIDIAELFRGAEMTRNDRATKETLIQDFLWGIGPETLYQITRAECKTEPDRINLVFQRTFSAYKTNTTIEENSFGPNKLNQRDQQTFGGD